MALALGACGTSAGGTNEKVSVEELNRTIHTLRTQNAAYARQLEELENRVFVLTDQLDSRKVNEQRKATPDLPTVLLRPEPKEEPAPLAPGSFDGNVEYAGDAAKSGTKRPVLRLWGDETPVLPVGPVVAEAPRVVVVGEKSAAGPRSGAASGADPPAQYRRLLGELQSGHYDEALAGFRDYVRLWPRHDLADNAQYWMGECFYHQGEFQEAVREFRVVVDRFPQGNKVPDALLKIGYSYLALGQASAGRQTLEQLVRSYPQHYAASLATAKLRELEVNP